MEGLPEYRLEDWELMMEMEKCATPCEWCGLYGHTVYVCPQRVHVKRKFFDKPIPTWQKYMFWFLAGGAFFATIAMLVLDPKTIR